MKNLNLIAEELFNKIRGRFPSITIGNENGEVTNVPSEARFYDFEYKESARTLGKISVTLTDSSVTVMYSNDFVTNEDQLTKDKWYNFLRELRSFAKKRLLNFDARNITKTNLDTRDYKFLATTRLGDITMESKMYGTNKTSYQNVGNARVTIKHSKPVNTESATGRIQNVSAIYIESAEGERFKYPIKHLNGARAMARHVSEGGKPFDEFGQHITGLSEELGKLKKFKSYVNRSSVMAEGLGGYVDVVNERISEVKKTVERLQKESFYKEAFDGFETPILEDVPSDVAENWIDQLTVKQFNEELKDVFPYIYRLIGEATRAKELNPDDLLGEVDDVYPPRGDMEMDPSNMRQAEQDYIYTVKPGDTVYNIAQKLGISVDDVVEINGLNDPRQIRAGQQLRLPGNPNAERIGAGGTRELGPDGQMTGSTRGINPDRSFEEHMNSLMGQFGEADDVDEAAKKGLYYYVNKRKKAGTSRSKNNPKAPSDQDWKNAAKTAKEGIASVNVAGQNKMNGKKKPTEKEGKTPLPEFILSYFDRNSGQFPKGETAILTMVEKDYGEQFITPAKQFIEMINNRIAEMHGYRDTDTTVTGQFQHNNELNSIKNLAGLIKTG